jgi:hypothetical protein
MKNLKQSKNGLKTVQNEVKNVIDFLTISINELNTLTAEEQIKWFEARQNAELENASKRHAEAKQRTYKLLGSNVVLALIYRNSVNSKVTTLIDMWNEAQTIENAKGQKVGMTWNAFTRTFNTSTYTLAKKGIKNVSYFENMNELINGKLAEKFDGISKNVSVFTKTVELQETEKSYFGKNNISQMNTFLIMPFSLETVKKYLELKGANAEQLGIESK